MSAFPGVHVESLKVESPPFDEPGVVQEFVGEGVTKELPEIPSGDRFDQSNVSDFISEAKDMIGIREDLFRLRYTLLIRQPSGGPISKRGAKATARAFTRAKNPFEADVVNVRSVSVDNRMSGSKLGTVYRVVTVVDKS